jgi:hypothetical protein
VDSTIDVADGAEKFSPGGPGAVVRGWLLDGGALGVALAMESDALKDAG